MRKVTQRALMAIGAYVCARKLYDLAVPLIQLKLESELDIKSRYGSGSWAVVTGGSRGIGKEIAASLARRGFNIVLVSKDPDRLRKAAEEIKSRSPRTNVREIVYDFSASPDEIPEKLVPQLSNMDVSILVNNVSEIHRGEFTTLAPARVAGMINVNSGSMAVLTSAMREQLSNRKNRSAVVVISSQASYYPRSYMALYDATKSFDDFLTLSISREKETSRNIDYLLVRPARVSTDMIYNKMAIDTITPHDQAEVAIKQLGKRTEAIGHWKHHLFRWVVRLFPHEVYLRGFERLHRAGF